MSNDEPRGVLYGQRTVRLWRERALIAEARIAELEEQERNSRATSGDMIALHAKQHSRIAELEAQNSAHCEALTNALRHSAELEALLAQVAAGRDHAHERMAEFAAVLREVSDAYGKSMGAVARDHDDLKDRIDAALGAENRRSHE